MAKSTLQRVNAAHAFAAGFKQARTPGSDPHPTALLVLRVALLDRETRAGTPAAQS